MLLLFTPVKDILVSSPRSGPYFSNSAARCSVQVKCSFACRCLSSVCVRQFGRSKPEVRPYASSTVSQSTEVQAWEEESLDYLTGPLSGDLAEIEAFCRIQRIAEELHKAVMDRLRNLDREEQPAVYVGPYSSLDERVVAGLACIGATLQQGRMDILGGWAKDIDQVSANVPRLSRFREKLRMCCKSLRVSLQSLIAVEGENLATYSILQRLNNICLDAGFPRSSGAPGHGEIPNFGKVRLEQTSNEVDFWKGGQLTEDGLKWLVENRFRTIVDLRAEEPEKTLAEAALVEAENNGKIRRVKIPVKPETAPTMEQVREFARLVADVENRPIFLQSYAGIIRTSAMISRWREFVFRGGLECGDAVDGACADLWSDDSEAESPQADIVTSTRSGEIVVSEGLRPFYAQLPGPDIFSRKAMSRFFRKRRITPSTILLNPKYKQRRPRTTSMEGSQEGGRLETGRKDDKERTKNEPRSPSSNGAVVESSNGALAGAATNVDHAIVGGDMCSTKTGVVRLQSRKKAEMYLVRADGFSCTRERVMESTLAFTHPSTQQQMLMWKTPPKTVLLLKKLGDELMEEAMEVAAFLHNQEGMNVMVEPEVHDQFARYPGFGYIQTFYSHDLGSLHERVDFVVCLGGDGVILHVSNLFRSAVPPVVSFNLGSLGFLTAHPFEDFKHDLRAVIHGNERIEGVYVTLRMRLRCEILRDGRPVPGKVFEVLNEVVVDRGSNPYLCKIECYERNRLITKVQADGVLVATPTGSTAYNTAAGGSMVHPNVPCMLFTPICPHSLSFRPVILPDSAILELKVPEDARSNAFVSFDGKRKQAMMKGESIRVSMSEHPMSTVNKSDQTNDWFASLSRCFGWNQRAEQKAMPTVY